MTYQEIVDAVHLLPIPAVDAIADAATTQAVQATVAVGLLFFSSSLEDAIMVLATVFLAIMAVVVATATMAATGFGLSCYSLYLTIVAADFYDIWENFPIIKRVRSMRTFWHVSSICFIR